MTETPNLSALAMRTRAAEYVAHLSTGHAAEILALPLEADPAALVAEAAKVLDDLLQMRGDYYKCLTQDDAQMLWDAASKENGYAAVSAFLTALAALVQP